MNSYLWLILYQNMKKYLAVPIYSEGLPMEFCIGMFLPIYTMDKDTCSSAHTDHLSLKDAHSVINSDKEMNMVSKCLEKCA